MSVNIGDMRKPYREPGDNFDISDLVKRNQYYLVLYLPTYYVTLFSLVQ